MISRSWTRSGSKATLSFSAAKSTLASLTPGNCRTFASTLLAQLLQDKRMIGIVVLFKLFIFSSTMARADIPILNNDNSAAEDADQG